MFTGSLVLLVLVLVVLLTCGGVRWLVVNVGQRWAAFDGLTTA